MNGSNSRHVFGISIEVIKNNNTAALRFSEQQPLQQQQNSTFRSNAADHHDWRVWDKEDKGGGEGEG